MIVWACGVRRNVKIRKNWKLIDLLDSLGILVEEVVILRDGAPVPETEPVKQKDKLKIVRICSSG